MGAKHRMTEPSQQRRPASDLGARRMIAGAAAACDAVFATLLCMAALTALLINAAPKKPTVVGTLEPTPASHPVRQEGTIVAVSENSVTARSANGYTQTYLVTPNTALISRGDSQHVTVTSHFAINDRVDIVGTIRNGTALATAVADRGLSNGAGPPMDYPAPQPVSVQPAGAQR